MKVVLRVLLALGSLGALPNPAQAWEKIISCNNDALVVDTACYSYRGAPCYTRDYQLVINNQDIANHFNRKGAIGYYQYGRGFLRYPGPAIINSGFQFIVSEDKNYVATRDSISISIPFADTHYAVEYTLRREGRGMLFRAVKTDENRNDIAPRGELANWYFEDCRSY